jgi:hypothetical protein
VVPLSTGFFNSPQRTAVIEVQLRSVPPYVASAVWVVINAYISQRLRLRFLPLLYNMLLVVVGYTISVSTKNSAARYAACFLVLMGASVGGPMVRTLTLVLADDAEQGVDSHLGNRQFAHCYNARGGDCSDPRNWGFRRHLGV